MSPPFHVAVLGGGVTGLAAAFHLARRLPAVAASVTIVEKQPRLGGWVRSERVTISRPDSPDATVLLEVGPRTLRPNSKALLELIHLLDLQPSLITVPTNSPVARFRYLHVPTISPHLLALPNSFFSILSSPLTPTLLPPILAEPFRAPNRPATNDESVDAFLTRRFGPEFARVFGSALMHGIYAADASALGVHAVMPSLWDAETRGGGSVVRGAVKGAMRTARTAPGRVGVQEPESSGYELGDTERSMRDVSVYTFREGLGTITTALEKALRAQKNVRIMEGAGVESLDPVQGDASNGFQIRLSTGEVLEPSHVVSALPLPALHAVLPRKSQSQPQSPSPPPLPHLAANTYSSVTLVNMVFPPSSQRLNPSGFGYLIPRSPHGYDPANDGILGVTFDLAKQDQLASDPNTDPGFTKMTAMLGGPHPLTPAHSDPSVLLPHIAAHLGGGPLPPPLLYRVHPHTQCIPLLGVGHAKRMDELRQVLSGKGWCGRLEVVGAGVGGVSVGDCVEAGRRVGRGW